MTEMQYQTYFSKLLGCYIGKTIGGTLGMPYEGNTNVNNITYYDPIPTSVVGNDDVDLQVVWVECLRRHGLPVNRKHLADAWRHVRFAPDEYGIMLNNTFQNGLSAPLCGFYNNKFYAGMGAAIRSELWASLAPGDPKLAVSLAREDACTDHYGDGMDACLFLTAIESAAYVEDDFDKLIQIGLSFLPAQSRFARSIMDTLRWWKEEGDCYAVRDKILEKYGVDNWTDVCINVSFTVLAWAAGSGDFGKSVCLAVNMGYDADCTAATLGSILGIINPDGIDEKWTKPIGNRLILSPNIVGMHTVKTVAEFCDQITALAVEVQEYYNSSIRIIGCPPLENARKNMAKPWMNKPELVGLKEGYDNRESLLSLSPLLINLRYPESVALLPNLWNAFEAEITNPSDVLTKVHLHLCVPDGFHLSEDRFSMELHPSEKKKIRFDIRYDSGNEKKSFNSLDFRMQVNGLIFNVTAGLPTAYPWIRKKGKYSSKLCPALDLKEDFEFAPSNAFFQTVPPGEYIYAIDVKADVTRNAVIVCQGTREMKIWMNGEFLYTFDGTEYVPAVHRSKVHRTVLPNRWNRIIIKVTGYEEPGELFFGIADPSTWRWPEGLEWRNPFWNEEYM
jgi:ADP-ribosylglycohydrolase